MESGLGSLAGMPATFCGSFMKYAKALEMQNHQTDECSSH